MKLGEIKNDKPELTFGLQIGEYQKLNKSIENLDRCVRSLADNFVSIGYYLNDIKESKVFKDLGFEDIYEFAESKYHFGKTSTKNFINVYLKFGKYDCCPMLQSKYQNYNFSQLVELLPESEEALNKYDPSQTVKEIRLTKFQNSLNEDQSKLEKWLQKDLCSFLKKEYPQTSLKFYGSSYSFFELKYKKYELNFYKEDGGIIRMVSYDLKKKFEAKTILSLRLISVHVDLFVKKVDEEMKSQTSDSAEEIETNGQTSDRETVEVEVVDAVPARPQKLKNDKMREEFIRNSENWNLLYDLTEVNARIFRHKEVPEFFEIQYFGKQYGTDPEMAWHHAEWHLVKDDETFGRSMFHYSGSSISVLVAFLKDIKF